MKCVGAGRKSKDLDKKGGVLTASIISEQNQDRQIPILEEEGGHKVSLLAEKLLAIDGP